MNKKYDKWCKQIFEEDFPDLNKYCIKFDNNPGNLYTAYQVKGGTTVVNNDQDSFTLIAAPENNTKKRNASGICLVTRFTFSPDHFSEFNEFRKYVIACTIEALTQVALKTGKRHNDYVFGDYYLTFVRPGNDDRYVRQLETSSNLELRGYTRFATSWDKESL